MVDLTGAPIIKGTWPEGAATKLAITVGKSTYRLGTDANLSSDGKGNWTLLPSSGLADGKYNVVATASNADRVVSDASNEDLVVDATPPTAPTVDPVSSNEDVATVTGTYDAARTKTLTVDVPALNLRADLGTAGSALTADAAGKWTLALPKALAPGSYDVAVTATDARDRSVSDAGKDEVVVVAKDQPLPKTDRPYDCTAVIDRIATVFPMRFIYAKVDFAERFGTSVDQYAALLKDPRCAKITVEVAGHADERGDDAYNMGLGERRGTKVRDMLVQAGVDASRLTVMSYGESQPLDPASTEEAWAKNRRVEIRIVK
ncbi:MAG: OmpA family protein [Hyphomicrobiales bacterium]